MKIKTVRCELEFEIQNVTIRKEDRDLFEKLLARENIGMSSTGHGGQANIPYVRVTTRKTHGDIEHIKEQVANTFVFVQRIIDEINNGLESPVILGVKEDGVIVTE